MEFLISLLYLIPLNTMVCLKENIDILSILDYLCYLQQTCLLHTAFSSVVFLINRFPSPVLTNLSPYQKLFHNPPNYQKLRTFGCLCYPWLRPYAPNKLEFRSMPCVFVGYSLTQSAYQCLDPVSGRLDMFVSTKHNTLLPNYSTSNLNHLPRPPPLLHIHHIPLSLSVSHSYNRLRRLGKINFRAVILHRHHRLHQNHLLHGLL